MTKKPSSGRWVALITGFISVAIGLLYLLMITVLDSRGPMLPPPPEALGVVEVGIDHPFFEGALRLFSGQFLRTFP